MIVARHKDNVLFMTPFSNDFDLVQKFTVPLGLNTVYNNPVNYKEAGLMNRKKWDMWHIDIPFSIMNDEATPCIINGKYLGANHVYYGAVAASVPGHNKSYNDIGARYCDKEGSFWTLVAVEFDVLTFMSDNIGASLDAYKFKQEISFPMTYVENGENTSSIDSAQAVWISSLQPILRHNDCRILAYKDGESRIVSGYAECDRAEIVEEYEVVNPASMVDAIRSERPVGGYSSPITKALGTPMYKVKYVYRIESDGAVVVDFKYDRLSGVRFTRSMGAMFQEKLDAFGGGVYRYIPKSLPFETEEGRFDFSSLTPTAPGAFPGYFVLTRDYWKDPDSPPDRIVDYMFDKNGVNRIGFACGYLPVYDGAPEIRAKALGGAVHFKDTRKGYPMFTDGVDLLTARGVAYKKYFMPSGNVGSVYSVENKGESYLYFDIFEKGSLSEKVACEPTLLEKSPDVSFSYENGTLTVSGERGYAVFVYRIIP